MKTMNAAAITCYEPNFREYYIGFELSPSSSHMSVSGIKSGKTQKEIQLKLL